MTTNTPQTPILTGTQPGSPVRHLKLQDLTPIVTPNQTGPGGAAEG